MTAVEDGAGGTALSIRDVSVAFGGVRAVDGVTLDVAAGETLAVVGPSGSGKSTLLRAVAGLEPLVSGEIRSGGRSLATVPVHQRDLGLMFQDGALFPHLDVADNVAFGLAMKGWPEARRRARVADLLALVGLEGLGGRAVHELSGGEAQRVALARALAPEPALLMLDEPFGSLDRVLREQLTAEVRRLLHELGQTALHVTHDQGEAFALADRVAVLAGGRLVQVGEPAELWRRPADAFVAGFLGHPNIWRAELGPGGRLYIGGIDIGGIDIAGIDMGGIDVGGGRAGSGPLSIVVPVTALRPDPAGAVVVGVDEVEFRQGRYRVMATLAVPEAAVGPPPTVVYETERPPRPGDRVTLAIDEAQLWPLDGPVSKLGQLDIAS